MLVIAMESILLVFVSRNDDPLQKKSINRIKRKS